MGQSNAEMEQIIMEAAEMVVEEVAEFWGLDSGSLTLQGLLESGKNPLAYAGPLQFKAAVEAVAIGKAKAQQEARAEQEPPEEPSEQEREDVAWAEYEARVAATTDPDELAKLHAENEALLRQDADRERLEARRRGERAFALREKARKQEATPNRGITEEDWSRVGRPDEHVERAKKPRRSQPITSDPKELYDLWVEQGSKVPGPDGK